MSFLLTEDRYSLKLTIGNRISVGCQGDPGELPENSDILQSVEVHLQLFSGERLSQLLEIGERLLLNGYPGGGLLGSTSIQDLPELNFPVGKGNFIAENQRV